MPARAQPVLDRQYAVFSRAIHGMNVVRAIAQVRGSVMICQARYSLLRAHRKAAVCTDLIFL